MTDQPQTSTTTPSSETLAELCERILSTVEGRVLGQREAAEGLLATYLAGGHTLLEGVPGIGKTLLANTFAAALGLDFQRVQFTPDLMPADVVGTNIFRSATGQFELLRGPIFTRMLMADEINRTPPKTQSALLEAMQERQVTIDGERHPLDDTFFVVATQNPVEFEGTYPLPEAQLDRFATRIQMQLPPPESEIELYRRAVHHHHAAGEWDPPPQSVVSEAEARTLRGCVGRIHVSDELLTYLAQLAERTRKSPHVELAISPRGALALLAAARAAAVLEGRDHLIPDDLKRFLAPCWGHRMLLTAEAELEGLSIRRLLDEVAEQVEVPR